MSFYTVTLVSDDAGPISSHTYETDSETLSCVTHIIGLLDDLENDERIEITADIF